MISKKTTALLVIFVLVFLVSAMLVDRIAKYNKAVTPTTKAIAAISQHDPDVTPDGRIDVTKVRIILTTIIIILTVGTTLNVGLITLNQRQQQTQIIEQDSPKLKQAIDELKTYILVALYHGLSESAVKQESLKVGWRADVVNAVFRIARSDFELLNNLIKKSQAEGMPKKAIEQELSQQQFDRRIVKAALQNQNN